MIFVETIALLQHNFTTNDDDDDDDKENDEFYEGIFNPNGILMWYLNIFLSALNLPSNLKMEISYSKMEIFSLATIKV